jgi:hypothetical protein
MILFLPLAGARADETLVHGFIGNKTYVYGIVAIDIAGLVDGIDQCRFTKSSKKCMLYHGTRGVVL